MLPARGRPNREEVRPDRASSLSVEERRPAGFPFAWHEHAFCELTLIQAGRGLRLVGDGIARFAAGDLVLIGPGLPHTWASDPGSGACHCVVVKFPAALIAGGEAPTPEQLRLRPLIEGAGRGLAFTGPGREAAAEHLAALARERSPVARLGRLHLALAALAENATAQPLSTTAAAPARDPRRRLARVMAAIHAGSRRGLGQAEAACAAGMHPAAFSRFFRRQLGKTFIQHLAEVRCAELCRRLAETDEPVLTAALASGFASLASCNRWFRRLRGMNPRAYRLLARGG